MEEFNYFLLEWLIAIFTVVISVWIHSRVMLWLKNSRNNNEGNLRQSRIFNVMLCLIFTHMVEICVFAIAYKLMLANPKFGSLSGSDLTSFTDYLYYSSTVYTTLGFGDIVPHGLIRLFTSIESLTGLSLVAWSMSVAFLEIQHIESNKK
ncbi:MAG: potassium channel family protein [Colwellia sp.]|nr:potassium channel family protein [Colwellia sp.]MCW9081278.1 potassium channel family protein [Colwellia sp.]